MRKKKAKLSYYELMKKNTKLDDFTDMDCTDKTKNKVN